MCIIAVQTKHAKIAKQTLETMFANNPDGSGFMYSFKGYVYLSKGFMTFSDFFRNWKAIPEGVTAICHFRIQTAGGVVPGLTHPFPVSDTISHYHALDIKCRSAFCHNGIIPVSSTGVISAGESDTTIFGINRIFPLLGFGRLPDSQESGKIENLAKTSKFAFLDGDGKFRLLGSPWLYEHGCYYSNESYQADYYKPPTRSAAWYISSSYDSSDYWTGYSDGYEEAIESIDK